jgi:hypothetical protein
MNIKKSLRKKNKSMRKQSKKNKSMRKHSKKNNKDYGGGFSSTNKTETIYFDKEKIKKIIERKKNLKKKVKNFDSVIDNIIVDFTIKLHKYRKFLKKEFEEDSDIINSMYNSEKQNIRRENIENHLIDYIETNIKEDKEINIVDDSNSTKEYEQIKKYIYDKCLGHLTPDI